MSTFGSRARIATALAALAVAIGTPAAHAQRPEPCRTANLSLALDHSRHEAGLNHFGVDVVLTNEIAEQPCVLRGYLGIGLYDREYRRLPTTSVRGDTYFRRDPGPATVLLRGGRTARAEITWSHPTSPAERATHASYLRIAPPGGRGGPFTVPFDQVNPGIYRGAIGNIALR